MARTRTHLVIALAILAASCGGGGGGGGGVEPLAAPASITADNAPVIAAEVLQVAFATSAFANGTGNSTTSGASASPAVAAVSGTGGEPRRRSGMTAANPAAQAVVGPDTLPCDVAGTVTISGNVQGELTLAAGDRITADFVNCDDGDGTVLDGLLDLTVQSYSGDPFGVGGFAARLALVLTDLTLVDGADAYTARGDVTLDVDFDEISGADTTTIFGQDLDVRSGTDAWRLTDFATTTALEPLALGPGGSVGSVSVTASGTLEGSGFQGTVDFQTVTPFRYPFESVAFSASGEMLLSGANGATIRVRGTGGSDDVTLDVDLDGDDTVDVTLGTSWDLLLDG